MRTAKHVVAKKRRIANLFIDMGDWLEVKLLECNCFWTNGTNSMHHHIFRSQIRSWFICSWANPWCYNTKRRLSSKSIFNNNCVYYANFRATVRRCKPWASRSKREVACFTWTPTLNDFDVPLHPVPCHCATISSCRVSLLWFIFREISPHPQPASPCSVSPH